MVTLKDKNYGRGNISGVGGLNGKRGERGQKMDEKKEKYQKRWEIWGVFPYQESALWLALFHRQASQDSR